jgi:hypothetical protein
MHHQTQESLPPNPGYWFPKKKFGWGWGLPIRPQGWITLVVYMVVLFAEWGWTMGVSSCLLIFICWLKGEPIF